MFLRNQGSIKIQSISTRLRHHIYASYKSSRLDVSQLVARLYYIHG
jgi:hypothetical protein